MLVFFCEAIVLISFQNGSSKLILVLWPLTLTDRLMIGDFMLEPPSTFAVPLKI